MGAAKAHHINLFKSHRVVKWLLLCRQRLLSTESFVSELDLIWSFVVKGRVEVHLLEV